MTLSIAQQRLATQRLVGESFASAQEAVQFLTAVQAQDYPAAKWGLAQRVTGAPTSMQIDELFNAGAILRTHVMRPTWHFVLPDDIRWLQQLTAPRVKKIFAYYCAKVGLDDATLRRASAAFEKSLPGRAATRTDIKQILDAHHIDYSGLRLGFILANAELDCVLCSGPMKGKQHTFALLAERAPHARELSHDEALAELTLRYFTSHGPAQPKDFAWWSGLTLTDAKRGLDMAGNKLRQEAEGGKAYWFAHQPTHSEHSLRLLPNYDELLIAYTDRSDSIDSHLVRAKNPRNSPLFNHGIVQDGYLVGMWRRTLAKDAVTIDATLFQQVSQADIRAQAQRYADFLDLRLQLNMVQSHS